MASALFQIAGVGDLVDTILGDAQDGFQSGFIFELIDDRKAAALMTFVFVVNPTRYEISEPFQAELTPTEDNTVISEETGIILREITIEGTFGLNKRKGYSHNGLNKGASVGGTEHFLNLRRMFRKYSEIKKDPSQSPYVHMVMHVLKDDDHFEVVPREFISPRDSRVARVHRIFRLRLTAIDGPNFGTRFRAKSDDELDGFAAVAKALNDARAAFADTNADLARFRRRVGNFNAVMLQAAGVITAVGNFVRGIRSTFISLPLQLVVQTALSLETIADQLDSIGHAFDNIGGKEGELAHTMRQLSASLDNFAQHPNNFASPNSLAGTSAALTAGTPSSNITAWYSALRLTQDDLDGNLAGATVGTKTRITSGSDRDGQLNLGSFQGVTTWIVQRTDSLKSIANATSSEPEAIVLLNDLRYPYISEGGGPGIAKPGDKILVPSSAGNADAVVPASDDYFSTEDMLYGVDLALDMDRLLRDGVMEIKVDETHGAADAELVTGIPNAVQGITIILNSEFGSTTFAQEVGVRRVVGEKGTMQHTLLSAVRLRDGVLSDDRVEDIESISVVLDADVLSQEMVLKLIDGRTVPLAIPFGKASGQGAVTVK